MEAWFNFNSFVFQKISLITHDTFDFFFNLNFWTKIGDYLNYNNLNEFDYLIYFPQTFNLKLQNSFNFIINSSYVQYFNNPIFSIITNNNASIDTLLVSFLLFFSKFFFLFIISFISTTFLFDLFFENKKFYYIHFINFYNFVDSEEEIGALDDFLNFLFLFVFCFIWFFTTIYFFSNFLYNNNTWVFFCLLFIIVILLSMPIFLFYNLGFFSSFYIKGCGSSNKIFFEIIFDSISLLTVVFRVFIQNIRLAFIFLALLELFTWIYTSSQLNSFLFFLNKGSVWNFYIINTNSFYEFFFNLLNVLILFFYYFLHLIFLIFTQLSVYFLLIFWVFFFLYTCFFFFKFEVYFLNKKI